MLKTIDYFQLVTVCIGLLLICSFIFPLIIEAAKKLLSEEKIIKMFKSMELFSLFVSVILGLIVYIVYLVFFIIGTATIIPLDIVKFILIGIIFVFSCGLGSQVGYDKVIKVLKDIFHIN